MSLPMDWSLVGFTLLAWLTGIGHGAYWTLRHFDRPARDLLRGGEDGV